MKVIAFKRPTVTGPVFIHQLYLTESEESEVPFATTDSNGLSMLPLMAYSRLIQTLSAVPLPRMIDYDPGHLLLCVPAAYCDDSWSTEHFQWVAEVNLFVRYLAPDKLSKALQHWVMCLLLLSTYAAIKEDWALVEKYSERTTEITKLFNKLHGKAQ